MEPYDSLTRLLKHAELNVTQFNVSSRTDMNYRNRVFTSYYMMSYHKSGYAKLRVGSEIYEIGPGSVIFIPPHLPHDQYKDTSDEAVILWWHFTFKAAKVLDVLQLFDIPYIYKLQHMERFEAVFEQFMEAQKMNGRVLSASILQQAKALELLYLLLDEALDGKPSMGAAESSGSFLSLLCKIVQHPETGISLRSIAKEMHMNPTYVSGRFRELFGQSPIQLQRKLKIEKAKTLLAMNPDLSIGQIAEAVGFAESAHFTRLFKSYTGIAPLQYRQLAAAGGPPE